MEIGDKQARQKSLYRGETYSFCSKDCKVKFESNPEKYSNVPEDDVSETRLDLYSLIETAKANGLEPYWYLKYLFENLPEAMTADEFTVLMPQKVDKNMLAGPAA